MKGAKLMKAVKLSIPLVVVLLIAAVYVALQETPEEQKAREALEERAKSEVMLRMSPTPDFDSISNRDSASFDTTLCGEQHGWIHQIGVMEAIDVTSPNPGRAYLKFCVNTDSWRIESDNDLAKNSTTDESAYLDAQGYCSKKTDDANRLRDKALSSAYGETFLRVIPSGTDVLANDFSCTSSFSFPQHPNQELAIWRMFPNRAISDDYPITVEATRVQIELSGKDDLPPQPDPTEQKN